MPAAIGSTLMKSLRGIKLLIKLDL